MIAPILQNESRPSSPVRDSIIAAGDYLVRQQLSNGELAYQVDIMTNNRVYPPSPIRLIAGVGALFTTCRVSGDEKHCTAGDRALDFYLDRLVEDPGQFEGACFYTTGSCELGGTALAVDAIYKRWQVYGDFAMGDRDLSETLRKLGQFIVWMRRPEGGFYHAFDPHFAGKVDPEYFVVYFPGESLLALMELYEMTGDKYWLGQAREVNGFMIGQPVTEDHWHSYALSMFARLDKLTQDDRAYAIAIEHAVIEGKPRSLDPANSSISAATKLEALTSLAKAFTLDGPTHEWLLEDMQRYATFVMARQLPGNNCSWDISDAMTVAFGGGIYSTCEDPSIRIDGLQHWINGATAYLEYLKLTGEESGIDTPQP